MKSEKLHENISVKKLPKSEIEITGAVPAAVFDSYRQAALKNLNGTIKMDGFRQGKIPEKVIVAKVGEKTVLEEMAELALSDAYPAVVIEHGIDPVGRPEITITKIASGNPLEFKILTAVMPEVKLGDYKKIAKETPAPKESAPATEKEIDEAVARVKKSHEGHDHDKAAGDHDHASFDTPEFREKVTSALVENKRMEAVEKRRIAMADKIVEVSEIDMPHILIKNETNRIETQFKDDIARMNINLDDYLKHAKKSLEDLRGEWLPHAEKKAKLQLALNKIADIEKILVEEKEIDAEVGHIMAHYKDADRDRTRAYAAGILTNEKVFQFLENQSGNQAAHDEDAKAKK